MVEVVEVEVEEACVYLTPSPSLPRSLSLWLSMWVWVGVPASTLASTLLCRCVPVKRRIVGSIRLEVCDNNQWTLVGEDQGGPSVGELCHISLID